MFCKFPNGITCKAQSDLSKGGKMKNHFQMVEVEITKGTTWPLLVPFH
jgi:hypothetical protein